MSRRRMRTPEQNIGIAIAIGLECAETLAIEEPDLPITEVADAMFAQIEDIRADLIAQRCGEYEIDWVLRIMLDRCFNCWADLRMAAGLQRNHHAQTDAEKIDAG